MNNIVTYSRNGKTYDANVNEMKPETIAYLIQYGWAQSLQDSIAGLAKRAEAEYREIDPDIESDELARSINSTIDGALSKRSDAILSGSITIRGTGESRDPLRTVANEMIARALVKKGTTRSKVGKERFDALVDQLLENNRAKVQAELDRRNANEVEVEV